MPTFLGMKRVFLRRGTVAAGLSLDTDTTAWVNAVLASGGSVTDTQKLRVDALIVSLKAHSLFSANSRLWLHAGESDAVQARVDIMGLATAAVAGHAPTLGAGGYTGNTSSMYIDYGTKPSNYAQNSASIGAYVSGSSSTVQNASKVVLGAYDGSSALTDIIPLNDASGYLARVNSFTSISGGNSNRRGFHLALTNSTPQIRAYYNGSFVTSLSNTTASIASLPNFYGCARNDAGVAGEFTEDPLAVTFIGPSLTDTDVTNLTNDIETYMDAWGVGVI